MSLENYPRLVKQWHTTKNGNLKPKDVTHGSNKEIWWKCDEGHIWQATVYRRVKGDNCPLCSGQKAIPGEKDLQILAPQIAAQWDYNKNGDLKPDMFLPKSHKEVFWYCETHQHSWKARISDRTRSRKAGCPICNGKKVVIGVNDLATLYPEIAEEWHPKKNWPLTPYYVTPGSDKKVWWLCEDGHEWEAEINRRVKGNGCPFHAGQKVIVGVNDIKTTHPEIAGQWHPEKNGDLKPCNVSAYSHKQVWWICKTGHEWRAPVYSRIKNGCPKCFMQTSYGEQATMYYISLLDDNVHNSYKYHDKYEVDIYIPDRKIAIEYNGDYAHRHRQERDKEKREYLNGKLELITLKEVNKIESITIQEGAVIFNRKDLKKVIEYLIKRIFDVSIPIDIERDQIKIMESYINLEKKRSLEAMYPVIAAQWDCERNGRLHPNMFSPKSQAKVYWKCHEHQYSWKASIANRTRGDGRCPVCLNKVVLKGVNDLATTNPEIAAQWHPSKNCGLTPYEVTAGSNKKVWWICDNGDEWEAVIYSRKKNGCPRCRRRESPKKY